MSINQFSGLKKIRKLVESYRRPAAGFDPQQAWTHRYDIYVIAYGGHFLSKGQIRISRKPLKDGARLDILTVRSTTEPDLRHYAQARLECADTLFLQPQRWEVSTKIAASETAEPYFGSGMTKGLRFADGAVRISVGGRMEPPVPVAEPFSCKFCLLDAVQRLPAGGAPALPPFGLFDEYDQLRGGYHLEFRETAPILLGNGTAPLSLYTLTGPGLVPASYWRDETGRLLFFISGLEVYVLAEENGVPIDFYHKPDVFNASVKLANLEES